MVLIHNGLPIPTRANTSPEIPQRARRKIHWRPIIVAGTPPARHADSTKRHAHNDVSPGSTYAHAINSWKHLPGCEDAMRRTIALIALIASVAAVGTLSPSIGLAQRHRPRAAGHAEPRPPVRRGAVVFIGGYYYDPFFGPYPWWPTMVGDSSSMRTSKQQSATYFGR